jgi:hypothetical protein
VGGSAKPARRCARGSSSDPLRLGAPPGVLCFAARSRVAATAVCVLSPPVSPAVYGASRLPAGGPPRLGYALRGGPARLRAARWRECATADRHGSAGLIDGVVKSYRPIHSWSGVPAAAVSERVAAGRASPIAISPSSSRTAAALMGPPRAATVRDIELVWREPHILVANAPRRSIVDGPLVGQVGLGADIRGSDRRLHAR